MNAFVTAVVVCHDADDFFAVTAQALANQTRKPDHALVIDSGSDSESDVNRKLSQELGFDYIRVASDSSLQDSIQAAISGSNNPGQWIWLLHDDSAPAATALEELVAAVERSPSVALAGPKLVRWQQPRTITQLGLTLTPGNAPFSPIDDHFDQGQHDDIDDVMAVGTAAMLFRSELFDELGGFDPAAPPLAADVDFSVRARLAGHRVIVAPKARVQHAELSLAGSRPRGWLRASPKTALRRAAIHLRFAYGNAAWLPLFWLALPLIGIARAVMQVSRKRPELIWSELASAIWGFFTVAKRLSSRRVRARTSKLQLRELKSLRASRAAVRAQRRASLEREEASENLAAFDRGDTDILAGKAPRGFFATGGLWWMVALAAISFEWWPRDVAVVAKGMIPLSASWWDVFTRAGASYQPIGLGFFAPSDPFAWVLTGLSGLTFWSPSLAITILLFLVKPLAFLGAWKLAAQVTESTWIRVVAGLSFAFWPALQIAQQDGRLTSIVAGLAAPWLVIALLRVAQIGRMTRSSSQSWTWVATAGLLLAIIGASTPNLIPLIFLGLVLLAILRIRRVGYLIWVGLPIAALYGPTVLYYLLSLEHPLAILADPGLAMSSQGVPFFALPGLLVAAGIAIVALFSVLRKRFLVAFTGWITVLLAVTSAYFVSALSFPAVGVGQAALDTVNGSPSALLIVAGLALVTLAALAVDGIPAKNARRVIASLTVVLTVLPGVTLAAISPTNLSFTDGRVVPSIVAAEAEQGSNLKLLVLTPSTDAAGDKRLAAELVAGDGVHLDDVSLAYRFSIATLANEKYSQIAQLVADLVSANGTPLSARLKSQHIGYVLVPNGSSSELSELGIALDSVSELETVGSTDLGRLWRVRDPKPADDLGQASPWSITKGVQVAILLGFMLMALPARNARRRGSEEIFIESGEDNQ
jgi:GT2 family glycosyltransferase